MSQSLKDQLLGLGFKAPPEPPRRKGPAPGKGARGGQPGKGAKGGQRGAARGGGREGRDGRSQEEIDLGRAWALRQKAEKDERIAAEKARQEEARLRREAREKLAKLLEGKSHSREDAELPRHFEYGGKIRRVYVTPEQLAAVNAGELGVVQLQGRYLLVDAAVAREAAAILPAALALLVDPSSPEGGDEYADPRFQVPDDILW